MNKQNNKELNVYYTNYWQTTIPSLQHTAVADDLLGNQFESLVKQESTGVIIPQAASNWSINNDFTIFRFTIDNTKHFSDGEILTAQHVKDAWIHGLQLSALSKNKSTMDTLYKVKGSFDLNGIPQLEGVRILDSKTLEIEFATPFRMALEHLSGVRYAVFKLLNEKYLGTGSYVIESNDTKQLAVLTPNPFNLRRLTFSRVNAHVLQKDTPSESIDVILTISSGEKFLTDSRFRLLAGAESGHKILILNGTTGVFSNIKYRQAFQYIYQELLTNNKDKLETPQFKLDPQHYVSGQKGRLSTQEAEIIIRRGEEYVKEFETHISKYPMKIIVPEGGNKEIFSIIMQKYQNCEIVIKKFNDILDDVYSGSSYDLAFFGQSLITGDPDGLYHALGKHGAILSSVSYREKVGLLLEEGRNITDLKLLDAHYQNVNRAILTEIPSVHIGFNYIGSIYNSTRIRPVNKFKKSYANSSFKDFEWK